MLPTLLIATGNAHKTTEFRQLLGDRAVLEDLSAYPDYISPEETGSTFEENAHIKALTAALATGRPALADDSGLEVDALDKAPGIYSSRFAGPDADDATNRHKLLEELARVEALTPAQRTARFRCVLVLVTPDGRTLGTWSGASEGSILLEDHGSGGFGYDPLFLPQGGTRSFAEIPAAEKNALSHRAHAATAFLKDWDSLAPALSPQTDR